MKCESGSCQYRSVAGLLKDLLKLAKVWHTEQVSRGLLTDEGWEEHYARYVAERLTPYLTSLQSHTHAAPVSIPFSTPEERGDSQPYDPRFVYYPKPSDVGVEYAGSVINSRYHVG